MPDLLPCKRSLCWGDAANAAKLGFTRSPSCAGQPACSCPPTNKWRRQRCKHAPPRGRRSTAPVRKSSQIVAVRPQRRRCPLSRCPRQSRCRTPAAPPAAAGPPAPLLTSALTLLLPGVRGRAPPALLPQPRHPANPQGGQPVPQEPPHHQRGRLAPAVQWAHGRPGWLEEPSLTQATHLLTSKPQGHCMRECNRNRSVQMQVPAPSQASTGWKPATFLR